MDGVQLASRGGRCEGNFDLSETRMQPEQEVTPDWLEQLPKKKHCKKIESEVKSRQQRPAL